MSFLITSLILAFVHFPALAHATDRYANFAELSKVAKEGDDFTIHVVDRGAKVTVIAIHGGAIEPHSEDIAADIAGTDLNLYQFIAAPKPDSTDLHLTSTHFDEPRALALTAKSEQCISVHGYLELEKDGICVGGAETPLRQKIVDSLNGLGLPITVEVPCARFGGSAPLNIVNRCKSPGVQLEVSTHLRSSHGDWFSKIADAVRSAIQ